LLADSPGKRFLIVVKRATGKIIGCSLSIAGSVKRLFDEDGRFYRCDHQTEESKMNHSNVV